MVLNISCKAKSITLFSESVIIGIGDVVVMSPQLQIQHNLLKDEVCMLRSHPPLCLLDAEFVLVPEFMVAGDDLSRVFRAILAPVIIRGRQVDADLLSSVIRLRAD